MSSPLETGIGNAFLAIIEQRRAGGHHGIYLGIQDGWTLDEFPPLPAQGLVIGREVVVDIYRVDFLLVGTNKRRTHRCVAVECDGYQFHDATDFQVRRDRSRDRCLTGKGFLLLRYGSEELFGNYERCARQAVRLATEGRI